MSGGSEEARRQLGNIVSQSVRHNVQVGISGHLAYDVRSQQVWQVLEGSPKVVGPLWEKIAADSRHTLDEDSVAIEFAVERRYPLGWGMRYSSFARGGCDGGEGGGAEDITTVAVASSIDRPRIVQLSYRSLFPTGAARDLAATGAEGGRELAEIVARSMLKNAAVGITGWLLYDARSSRVYQVLEGPPEAVERLWTAVLKDPRHRVDDESITRRGVPQREFPNWSMVIERVERPEWTWALAHAHVAAVRRLLGDVEESDGEVE